MLLFQPVNFTEELTDLEVIIENGTLEGGTEEETEENIDKAVEVLKKISRALLDEDQDTPETLDEANSKVHNAGWIGGPVVATLYLDYGSGSLGL